MPRWRFWRVSGTAASLVSSVFLDENPDGNQHSGTVGLELLRKFSNVNINLRDMTLMME